eukprot:SAG11_NODE_8414_length_1018_cov_1.201306_1_plen_85_part_00
MQLITARIIADARHCVCMRNSRPTSAATKINLQDLARQEKVLSTATILLVLAATLVSDTVSHVGTQGGTCQDSDDDADGSAFNW